ncbi:3306_t:CDS:2, partial [Scutellospora calospora]
PYEVLFFSRTPDEIFEDDDFDSDAEIVELTNKTNAIILDNENQINKEKLPVLPDFSYLKHNVPFHQ